jgi:hypothetical protein
MILDFGFWILAGLTQALFVIATVNGFWLKIMNNVARDF